VLGGGSRFKSLLHPPLSAWCFSLHTRSLHTPTRTHTHIHTHSLCVTTLPPALLPQGRENAYIKIKESEDLRKDLKEAVRANLATANLATTSQDEDGGEEAQLGPYDEGADFQPVELQPTLLG
jgi:hypothetical protein